MDTIQLQTRVALAHALAAGHPVIGIGGQIKAPWDAIVRELVVLHILLDGTIYSGDIADAVNTYAKQYEVVSHA